MTRVAAVILAAGAGRRFGGLKQLARVGGVPLVARAVRTVEAVPELDPVFVVVGAEARLVTSAMEPGRHELIPCTEWVQGIGASLRCGLEAAGDVDAVLVLLADQPLLDTDLVRTVLEQGLPEVVGPAAPYVAARAIDMSGTPGHPVLLGPGLLARAPELCGDSGMSSLLRGQPVLHIATEDLRATLDIDRPADLERAEQLAAGAPRRFA
jgi:molybdenum cofactor cytidylyltransferase